MTAIASECVGNEGGVMSSEQGVSDKSKRIDQAHDAVFDVNEVAKIIPHRYPFLFIDRVIEFVDNEKIVAIKNVSINEPFFAGHFPGRPVMPGVLIMEALAQAGAILAHKSSDGVLPGKTVFLASATDFRWKRPVVPGDSLRIQMTSKRKRRPMWTMEGEVTVDGKLVCSGTIMAAEVD